MLDTNVLVSGLLSPHGPPGRIVDLVVRGRLVPLYDDRIMDEYRDVLRRDRFSFDPRDVRDLLEYVRAVGEHVTARPWEGELSDPDDRPFLEVAVSAGGRAIVTGNRRDYRPRSGTHTVDVLSPRELLERGIDRPDPEGPPG